LLTPVALAAFADESVPPAAGQAPVTGILSERELEVLHLMAAGCSDREIANELVIAIGTAKRHAANIFDKLDVRNRTEAVTRARQLGLLYPFSSSRPPRSHRPRRFCVLHCIRQNTLWIHLSPHDKPAGLRLYWIQTKQ